MKKLTAETADKYDLYHNSVQDPESDVTFVKRVFKGKFERKAFLVREDFCGTAIFCAAWVKNNPKHRAIGVDLDPDPLEWAREHVFPELNDHGKHIELIQGDVLQVDLPQVDVTLATNFSYCVFKRREVLLGYFRTVLQGLRDEGCLVLDLFGGPEAQQEMEEPREQDGFDYIWDQDKYNPVTGDIECHIHFEFEDGTRMNNAFSYQWRLWGLPEIQDILLEAGFKEVDVYWEGEDEDGDGNGVFTKTREGTADECWICYIVAYKYS